MDMWRNLRIWFRLKNFKLFSFIALTITTVSSPCAEQEKKEILIGVSAGFKGAMRDLGVELFRGSQCYFQNINQKGGINGYQIRTIAYNDSFEPVNALANTLRLIKEDDVFVLWGYTGTPTVTRILPLLRIYQDKHFYLTFPFTGAQQLREPPYNAFVFNLRDSFRRETASIVDHFIKIGRKKIGVFFQNDAYGRSGWDGVKRALEKHELRITGEAAYKRGIDYTENLSEHVHLIKAEGVDAVICIGVYPPCAAFIREARNSGWDVPIANLSFVGSESLLDLLLKMGRESSKDYTQNLINTQVVPNFEDFSLPAVTEYHELFVDNPAFLPPANQINPDYEPKGPSYVSFEGFLNAKLLVYILKTMDPPYERSKIKEAIDSLTNIDIGIDTPLSFGPDNNQAMKKVFFTTVKNKKFVPFEDWSLWEK